MHDGKWWYTYDKNGNRTARARNAEHNGNEVTIDKNEEYWEYKWDYHNRLIEVQQFNAPENSQNVLVKYEYDPLNRRIKKVSNKNNIQEETLYAYGRNGAVTYQKKIAGDSVTTRSFVYLNNQIAGFMDKTEDGIENIRYAVADIQGSVIEVYDKDNSLLWKSCYTAFGIKAGETTKNLDFDGLYTGCDYDSETGLTYHWNRWRNEDGNSWLSSDPARDGLNWYGYAGQNPINYTDPTGLAEIPKLYQNCPAQDKVDYYSEQYALITKRIEILNNKIDKLQQEKKNLINDRKDAYKDKFSSLLDSTLSALQIFGGVDKSLSDMSLQDFAEFCTDFDLEEYVSNSFGNLIEEDINFLKQKYKIDRDIYDKKWELKH